MRFRSAILALSCVACCLVGSSLGQFSRDSTTRGISRKTTPRKISVGSTSRTIRVKPHAKNLQPDVGGTFIDLRYETNENAITLVTLIKVGGDLPPETDSFKWTAASTSHHVQFVNLEANTEYGLQIDLIPSDQSAPEPSSTFHPFKTLQRHVFIALEELHVYDDADWDGAGWLDFGVQMGPAEKYFNVKGNSWDFLNFRTQMHSGTTLNIPQTDKPSYMFRNNADSTKLKIAITANEKDYPFGPQFPFRPDLVDRYLGSGEDAYNEWNSGYELFDIGHSFLTPGATNLHQRESLATDFEIDALANDEADLSYSISGQLVVVYFDPN